jgi:uncharacterized protein YbaP (TraB family)
MKYLLQTVFAFLFIFATTSWTTQDKLSIYENSQNFDSIPNRLENSLLWEIKGKGIKKSYIFGTIHMISANDFMLSPLAKKCLKKSKKLVFEIDMSQAMAVSMKMLAMAPMRGNQTLSDLLSEEDYQLVKNYFTTESNSAELKVLPFKRIENWKPMLLQSFLYQDMIEGPVKAYEMELLGIGQKQKKKFGGLETIEDQIAVFEKIPYTDQANALVEMIEEIKSGSDKGKNQFKELIALYKSEDIDGMVEMSSEQFDEMENGQEELLNKRNNKWIPKITKMSKKDVTFYAVGAAHLGGPDGVIRLLMKAGYKVKALK